MKIVISVLAAFLFVMSIGVVIFKSFDLMKWYISGLQLLVPFVFLPGYINSFHLLRKAKGIVFPNPFYFMCVVAGVSVYQVVSIAYLANEDAVEANNITLWLLISNSCCWVLSIMLFIWVCVNIMMYA